MNPHQACDTIRRRYNTVIGLLLLLPFLVGDGTALWPPPVLDSTPGTAIIIVGPCTESTGWKTAVDDGCPDGMLRFFPNIPVLKPSVILDT